MVAQTTAAEVRAVEADVPMGMSQAQDGEAKVLFVKDATGLRAFQASCPHYGAPLAKGKLCGRVIYCPWHKAAFDVGDGVVVEPPALHGLEQYPIRKDGEKVVVTLKPIAVANPPAGARDGRVFMIVGSGAAAVAAISRLRRDGYTGRILLIGREEGEPYDRPMLSKNFLAKQTDPAETLLQKDFLAAHDVEFVMGPATMVAPAERSVTLQNGTTRTADAILVATGSRAVMPKIDGTDLDNIFTLRSLADAMALSAAAVPDKTIAIVGGGFVGLEAAAFLTKRGLPVTVIAAEKLPLSTRFGDEVAHALKVYHEGTGVRFVEGKVASFEGETIVREVRLDAGETIPADLVLIAVGAAPQTEAIHGLAKLEDGSFAVDEALSVAPNAWLAGDIATFLDPRSETMARIEHWRLAQQHGDHAARGMMGDVKPFRAAPFFWSNQGPKRLDYAGYAPEWDRIVTRGDVAKLDFIAFYVREGRPLAACGIGQTYNPQMIAFLHLLDEGRVPSADQLESADLGKLV